MKNKKQANEWGLELGTNVGLETERLQINTITIHR